MRRHPPSCLGTNPSGETKEGSEANLMRPRGFPRDYRHLAGPHEAPSAAEVGLRYIHFKAPAPVSLSVLANWHGLPRPWFPKCGPEAKRSRVGQA